MATVPCGAEGVVEGGGGIERASAGKLWRKSREEDCKQLEGQAQHISINGGGSLTQMLAPRHTSSHIKSHREAGTSRAVHGRAVETSLRRLPPSSPPHLCGARTSHPRDGQTGSQREAAPPGTLPALRSSEAPPALGGRCKDTATVRW